MEADKMDQPILHKQSTFLLGHFFFVLIVNVEIQVGLYIHIYSQTCMWCRQGELIHLYQYIFNIDVCVCTAVQELFNSYLYIGHYHDL